MGDTGDHADLATAIPVAPTLRWRIAASRHRLEREHRANGGDDLVLGEHLIVGPTALRVERHELDESDRDAFGPTELGEVDEFIVVDPAHGHDIELDRGQSGFDCRIDSVEHLGKFIAAGDLGESISAQ